MVVGYFDIVGNTAQHAFRWTTGGMGDLGTLGGTNSTAVAVNADGNVVVGYSDIDGDATGHAFRRTTSGVVDLGTLHGSGYNGDYPHANGVNADGSVVVGTANITPGGGTTRGFRWTQTGGMISVDNWLRAQGVQLAHDVTSTAQGSRPTAM